MAIIIDDEQNLRTVADLHKRLLDAIVPDARTVLDISGVTTADLSFVQVIEAARRHAAATGGDLCLAGPAPDAVRDVLDLAGFNSPAAQQFWTPGAHSQ